ncbi:MAG: nuclear transport factor 2 family protein [Chloroflexota bacterium]
MCPDPEIHDFLTQHFNSVMENNISAYHASTHEDLTLYEWWVTPHRIDGIPFHDFMISENARRGTVFGAAAEHEGSKTRFDFANLKIQRYGDTAIASYTLLMTTGTVEGTKTAAHNESRVMVKFDGVWKVVHVHKSPAWSAPHSPTEA